MVRRAIKRKHDPYLGNIFDRVTFSIGAEAADVITVTITAKTPGLATVAEAVSMRAWLSDDSDGRAIIATAPSGGAAAGTNGKYHAIVAGKEFNLVTSTAGVFNLALTEAGVKTCYLCIALPDGRIQVSGAITWA